MLSNFIGMSFSPKTALTPFWQPALDLYITRITINNNAPHLKSRPAMKLLEGGGGGGFYEFAVDQPSPLVLPWFLRHLVVWFAWKIPVPNNILIKLLPLYRVMES